jgi:translin
VGVTDLEAIVGSISADLELKNAARDRALTESRQVVRCAANAIRALHRGDAARGLEQLRVGEQMVRSLVDDLQSHPDLYWAGYVQDAQKEFAEANLVAAMIGGQVLPGPDTIGVENASYLNGLAEAASEMRRYILDRIRHGGTAELQEAERILAVMDDVYTSLLTVDFPDQITGGLRRTTDALRGVLERTRGDLTITVRQNELQEALLKR